jgi:hypothetical protein
MSTTEMGSSDLHTGLALLNLPGIASRLFRSPRLCFKWEACRQMGIFYDGLAFPSVCPGSHGWLGQQLAAAQSCTDHAAPDRSIRALVIQRHVHSFQSPRGVRVYLSSCYLIITNFSVPIRRSCTFCFLKGTRYKEELLQSMTYLVKVQLLA